MPCLSGTPKAMPLAAYFASLSLHVSLRLALRLAAMQRMEWNYAICVTEAAGAVAYAADASKA